VSGEWGDSAILIINWKWIRARLGKVKMFSRFFQMSDSFLITLFHICLWLYFLCMTDVELPSKNSRKNKTLPIPKQTVKLPRNGREKKNTAAVGVAEMVPILETPGINLAERIKGLLDEMGVARDGQEMCEALLELAKELKPRDQKAVVIGIVDSLVP
jgi:hypothetical protein